MKSHKVLILGIIIALLVLAAAGGLYWTALHSPQVTFTVSPARATIKVDGNPTTSSTINLTMGSHKIEVRADGYATFSQTITLKRSQSITINALLKEIPSATQLSNTPTGDSFVLKDSYAYYLGKEGRTIFRTKSSLPVSTVNTESVTPDTLSGISLISWNPDSSAALLKKSDGVYIYQFNRNDLINQTQSLWGSDIDQFDWAPNGISVAYTYYPAGGEASLIFADIQNKNIRRMVNLNNENIYHPLIKWSLDSKYMYMIGQSAQVNSNYLYIYDVTANYFKRVSEVENVKGAAWSPDSKHVAYLAPGSGGDNTVWTISADGNDNKDMGITAPRVDHISWTSNSSSLIVSHNNTLSRVNLNGDKVDYQVKTSSLKLDPYNIFQLPNEDRIIFINNNLLYSLTLVTAEY